MFITSQFNTTACECGIPLIFDLIRPLKEKLADITSVQVSNFVVTMTTRNNHSMRVGDLVEIISGGRLSSVFVGKHNITAITSNSISFLLRGIPDATAAAAVAYAYTVPNIANNDRYVVKFSKELVVPSNADVEITPNVYEIIGGNNFIPQTVVKIISNYTTSSKAIIKLAITDIYNTLLYTQYKQIVCSRFSDKPCEIIAQKPISETYIYLNRENNWTYQHNGFLIAQFIPDKNQPNYEKLSLRLIKPSEASLPRSTDSDRLILKLDLLSLSQRLITREQIKNTILENPISATLQKDIIVYDTLDNWVIQSSGLTIDQLKNLIVFQSGNVSISIQNIGLVLPYVVSPHSIPTVSILSWSDQTFGNYFFGEFIYNTNIYRNTNMLLYFSTMEENHTIQFALNNFAVQGIKV